MIYLLPGMGADHRMYASPAWQALPRARALDWPTHGGETTITAIASRVIVEAQIREDDVIVGSSLGGIVGCEIANQMRLRALILIGSAQSPDEISTLLALLHPLAALAPLKLVRAATEKLPGELCEMFAASDSNFVRTMCERFSLGPAFGPSAFAPAVCMAGMTA